MASPLLWTLHLGTIALLVYFLMYAPQWKLQQTSSALNGFYIYFGVRFTFFSCPSGTYAKNGPEWAFDTTSVLHFYP